MNTSSNSTTIFKQFEGFLLILGNQIIYVYFHIKTCFSVTINQAHNKFPTKNGNMSIRNVNRELMSGFNKFSRGNEIHIPIAIYYVGAGYERDYELCVSFCVEYGLIVIFFI